MEHQCSQQREPNEICRNSLPFRPEMTPELLTPNLPSFNCCAPSLSHLALHLPCHNLCSALLGLRTALQTSGFQSVCKQLGNAYSVLPTSKTLSRLKNKLFLDPEERGGHTALPRLESEGRLIRAETREWEPSRKSVL